MKRKIPIIPTCTVFLVLIALIVIVVVCVPKSTKVDAEMSQADSYGNVITIYYATDGTQIIFADNGVAVISPKDHKESFTQGYMRRDRR